ncbi:Plasma-membrane_choline transporter domain-containing protein [Hexamita inflata]|uniref:Plasma-membrane choline transporter domain-containing protein n=1 Tax=Hexamita inflata TaxID=28002 RepID=A0AA86TPC3_9EUKA|nr:Plasma-membrane choline transporter domain-containing protein [Hexamita inflata]
MANNKSDIRRLEKDQEKMYNRKFNDCLWVIVFISVFIATIVVNVQAGLKFDFSRLNLMLLKSDQFARACGVEQPDIRYPVLRQVFTSNDNAKELNYLCILHWELDDIRHNPIESQNDTLKQEYCNSLSTPYKHYINETQGTFTIKYKLDQDKYKEFNEALKPTYQNTSNTVLVSEEANICIDKTECALASSHYMVCDQTYIRLHNYIFQKAQENQLISNVETLTSQFLTEEQYTKFTKQYSNSANNSEIIGDISVGINYFRYSFLLSKMCHILNKHTFAVKEQTYPECQMQNYSSFLSKLSNSIKVPPTVMYIFNWIFSFRSYFIQEFVTGMMGILIGVLSAIVAGYILMMVLMLASTVITWGVMFLIPLGIFVLGLYLMIIYLQDQNKTNIVHTIFDVSVTKNSLLTFIVVIFCIALIIFGVFSLVIILFKKKEISLSILGLRLSWCVSKKRKRMLLFPLFFITLQLAHIAFVILFILQQTAQGTFDIQVGFFTFEKYNAETETTTTNTIGVVAVVMIAIYGIIGFFLINSTYQFIISQLTYMWYFDRISVQFKKQGKKKKRSYIQTFINYFKQWGTLCAFALSSTLLFPLKILCKLIMYVNNMFGDNVIVKKFQQQRSYARYLSTINKIINLSCKETIYYAALTGQAIGTSQKRSKMLLSFNEDMLKQIIYTSYSATYLCRAIIGVVSIFIAKIFVPSFTITLVLVSFILSFLVSGYVLNMILFINVPIIYCLNYDELVGQGQSLKNMPDDMRQLLEYFKKARVVEEDVDGFETKFRQVQQENPGNTKQVTQKISTVAQKKSVKMNTMRGAVM